MSEREEVVLCGASAYNKKFYLNQDFRGLPDSIKDDVKKKVGKYDGNHD